MLPNLLNLALTVIPSQTVSWMRFESYIDQPNGQQSPQFYAPYTVVGSFQPVQRANFQNLGLDFNKEYVQFRTSSPAQDMGRDIAGDRFIFAGATYQVMSKTDWQNVNGWTNELAVKIET